MIFCSSYLMWLVHDAECLSDFHLLAPRSILLMSKILIDVDRIMIDLLAPSSAMPASENLIDSGWNLIEI